MFLSEKSKGVHGYSLQCILHFFVMQVLEMMIMINEKHYIYSYGPLAPGMTSPYKLADDILTKKINQAGVWEQLKFR